MPPTPPDVDFPTPDLPAGSGDASNPVSELLAEIAGQTAEAADLAREIEGHAGRLVGVQEAALQVLSALVATVAGLPGAKFQVDAARSAAAAATSPRLTPAERAPGERVDTAAPSANPGPAAGADAAAGVTDAVSKAMGTLVGGAAGLPVGGPAPPAGGADAGGGTGKKMAQGAAAGAAGGPAGMAAGAVMGALEPLLEIGSKILMLLAPITGLAAMMGSVTSGMKPFTDALNLITASIAPVLVPVFAVLTAAALSVADVIWENLEPILGELYAFIATTVIEGLAKFADVLEAGWTVAKAFVIGAGEWKVTLDELFAAFELFKGLLSGAWFGGGSKKGDGPKDLMNAGLAGATGSGKPNNKGLAEVGLEAAAGKPGRWGDAARDAGKKMMENRPFAGRPPGGGPPEPGTTGAGKPPATDRPNQPPAPATPRAGPGQVNPPPGWQQDKSWGDKLRDRMAGNLRKFADEFAAKNGAQASFSGLKDVGRQVQLAALSKSPFEGEMLKRLDSVITANYRMVEAVESRGIGP